MKRADAGIKQKRVVQSSRGEQPETDPTYQLPFTSSLPQESLLRLDPTPGPRAIEDDSFPFEILSAVAETESWRKEIHRPTTHIHKWWAQRLGTVFRALVIGAFAPAGTDLLDLFYRPVRIPQGTVFDPFMGSGTTLAESVKLGARAIGRDINPVAHFLVKSALSVYDRKSILEHFQAIERDVADEIRSYYRVSLPDGQTAETLYYFWVKVVNCPRCTALVDLFSSMIFARHAYPKRFPQAQAVCPHCGGINEVHVDSRNAQCSSCTRTFDPALGPAKGQTATCPSCAHTFPIAKTVRVADKPPAHRLYAKLVLLPDGNKAYHAITDEDRQLFAKAEHALSQRRDPYPIVAIAPGYNTNQALAYHYRYWHEMFNARQLLCLSLLADRIRQIPDRTLRELFTCLFSGALEFNNMFASYKGEGTGAVRHMFAHHILKPERAPLEANLWGTPKSSGSFSTMFEGRIRRALDYADNPFELRVNSAKGHRTAEKVFGLSEKIGAPVADSYAEFARGLTTYLSCGDSAATDLPDQSVDTVITDPPFFDNVHYSQLADFFHVWQRYILGEDGVRVNNTTRSDREVQSADEVDFTTRLAGVWSEAHRVLKDDGLLIFTYHHSRPEGWHCVLQALMEAGFGITAAQPIKAEMSVAVPKHQAQDPIDLDIILVCRKRSGLATHRWNGDLLSTVAPPATDQARRLRAVGRELSRNDVRIIVMAQLVRQVSRSPTLESALFLLDSERDDTEALIDRIHTAPIEMSNKRRIRKRTHPSESSASIIFVECVKAIKRGELIRRNNRRDKEFHYQNWFKRRLEALEIVFDSPGRNSYPDFHLKHSAEGFELKGLAYPGRWTSYDCNSQMPRGEHKGRQLYYVFGRYPKKPKSNRYPVLDLVMCHGSFLSDDNTYVHENKSFRGFGTCGDILVRDRKMYVAPTPFALAEGTVQRRTLILPKGHAVCDGMIEVGTLRRREVDKIVVGYSFDLRTNEITTRCEPNPNAGRVHMFKAYRVAGDPADAVSLRARKQIMAELEEGEEDREDDDE